MELDKMNASCQQYVLEMICNGSHDINQYIILQHNYLQKHDQFKIHIA